VIGDAHQKSGDLHRRFRLSWILAVSVPRGKKLRVCRNQLRIENVVKIFQAIGVEEIGIGKPRDSQTQFR
jgi:hypothetical protein